MALQHRLYANEDRRLKQRADEKVDPVFLTLVLVLLGIGLVMLYSASYAQSRYDTGNIDPSLCTVDRMAKQQHCQQK